MADLLTKDLLVRLLAYCSLMLLAGCDEHRMWCDSQIRRVRAIEECKLNASCKLQPEHFLVLDDYRKVCSHE